MTRRKLLCYLSLLNGNELMRCCGFLPRIIRNGVLCFKFLFLIFSFLTSWSDINECSSSKGGCSHTCHNSAGSFTCSCPNGMELDSGKRSCKGKINITICARASMSTDRGELYVYLVRYQIRCCTQWSCRKYVKYDRSDLSTTIPFLKSSSE